MASCTSSYVESVLIQIYKFPPYLPVPRAPTSLWSVNSIQVPTITSSAASSSDSIIFADGPAIVRWQRQVAESVSPISDSERVLIDGANVTVMAQYIIDVLTFLRLKFLGNTSARFPTPHGIRNPRTAMTLLSFVQREYRRSYHM